MLKSQVGTCTLAKKQLLPRQTIQVFAFRHVLRFDYWVEQWLNNHPASTFEIRHCENVYTVYILWKRRMYLTLTTLLELAHLNGPINALHFECCGLDRPRGSKTHETRKREITQTRKEKLLRFRCYHFPYCIYVEQCCVFWVELSLRGRQALWLFYAV